MRTTPDPSNRELYDPFGEEDRRDEREAKRQRENEESKWVPRRRHNDDMDQVGE